MGSITEVDYLTQARSRYTQQFKNKPIFDAHINIFITEITEIQDMLQDLIGLRSLETAVGSQLDMIGAIVGQPRVLVNFTLFPFFGFDGASQAQTFGSLYDAALGGTWKSISDSEGASFEVDDDTYRFIIKARIVANISNTTPQGVIDAVNYIVGRTDSSIVEMGNAHLKITHYATLTTLQEYFLRGLSSIGSIIPLPICVSYEIEYLGGSVMLLHFDGANNSTVFTDSSPFNQTVSVATGTPKISTAMSKFGGSSLYLDGSSSIKIPNNANLNLGTGVFTIEFWFYLLSLPYSDVLFLHKTGTPHQFIAIARPSGKAYGGFLGASAVSTTVITTGAWYHVAVVRETEDGVIKQYINGVHEGIINMSGSVDNAGDLAIGYRVTGYIDEFRIRKEAVYTGNFTPQTAPFTY